MMDEARGTSPRGGGRPGRGTDGDCPGALKEFAGMRQGWQEPLTCPPPSLIFGWDEKSEPEIARPTATLNEMHGVLGTWPQT